MLSSTPGASVGGAPGPVMPKDAGVLPQPASAKTPTTSATRITVHRAAYAARSGPESPRAAQQAGKPHEPEVVALGGSWPAGYAPQAAGREAPAAMDAQPRVAALALTRAAAPGRAPPPAPYCDKVVQAGH
jgi:hypothetical protein